MIVTLYQPGLPPQEVSATGFTAAAHNNEIKQNQTRAAELLGCVPELVDVLASGSGYLIYSIFDCDGMANLEAMTAFTKLTDVELDASSDEDLLRGPVLVVRNY